MILKGGEVEHRKTFFAVVWKRFALRGQGQRLPFNRSIWDLEYLKIRAPGLLGGNYLPEELQTRHRRDGIRSAHSEYHYVVGVGVQHPTRRLFQRPFPAHDGKWTAPTTSKSDRRFKCTCKYGRFGGSKAKEDSVYHM